MALKQFELSSFVTAATVGCFRGIGGYIVENFDSSSDPKLLRIKA